MNGTDKSSWPLVVIDPGHGGADPGAVAEIDTGRKYLWVEEKDIVLTVCKDFKKAVEKAKIPWRVKLTREGDYFVTLRDRCRIANSWGARAFVSVHCNARVLRGKFGIEVETFHWKTSYKGKALATRLLVALLETMESYHEHENFIGKFLPYFQRKNMVFLRRRIDSANYFVLRETNMPSALVEIGFLSDPEEARYLMQRRHQKVAALGLVEGVEQYFRGE